MRVRSCWSDNVVEPPSIVCGTATCRSTECAIERETRWGKLLEDTGIYILGHTDQICGLARLVQLNWKDHGYCRHCNRKMKEKWWRLRQECWDDLDGWFGI